MAKTLIVAAHPDDEVLGCGGSIARFSEEGPVHILILGEGMTARKGINQMQVEGLHDGSRVAAEIMGSTSVKHCNISDNRFDSVDMLDVVKLIEAEVARLEPETVFTQHGGDLNIDHQITFQSTMAATRPMKECPVQRLYAYEVNSSTEWAFGQFAPAFSPNLFIDITEQIPKKIAAMEAYKSEIRPSPHPRSIEAITAQARKWGSAVGYDYAEAFVQVWAR